VSKQYKDNLVALSKILHNMDAPLEFSQEKWSTCIGHIAAKNGIGGLETNNRGWPIIDAEEYSLEQNMALREVFGRDIAEDIFNNEYYYNHSFKAMVEVVDSYLLKVFDVTAPKKVVEITLDASDIERLYKLLSDAETSCQKFDMLVINSNGDYNLSFGASVTSTR